MRQKLSLYYFAKIITVGNYVNIVKLALVLMCRICPEKFFLSKYQKNEFRKQHKCTVRVEQICTAQFPFQPAPPSLLCFASPPNLQSTIQLKSQLSSQCTSSLSTESALQLNSPHGYQSASLMCPESIPQSPSPIIHHLSLEKELKIFVPIYVLLDCKVTSLTKLQDRMKVLPSLPHGNH